MNLPNELGMIFHSRYQINVFQVGEMCNGYSSTIIALGSVGIMVFMQIGDAEQMMHGMGQVRKG
jgi:hypothetical protein